MKGFCRLGGCQCELHKTTVKGKPNLCFYYRERGLSNHSISIDKLVMCPKVQAGKLG